MADAPEIGIGEGRQAFGGDPAGYAAFRPGYPDRVYEVLCTRCGLGPGTATFEIGPATGLVTRRLAALGASPIVAIEPDRRLAEYLAEDLGDATALEVRTTTFEDADLEPERFDLGVSATAFHWVEQRSGLRKVARTLRPGGWWAMWWNVFGDPSRPDPFHEATVSLLERLGKNPAAGTGGIWPFALEREARVAELSAERLFSAIEVEVIPTTITLTPAEIRGLYATFSTITRLDADPRERLLDALERIAAGEFGGRVERNLLAALYTAQRTNEPVPA